MPFVSRRKSSPSKRAAVPVERDEAAGTLTARPSGKWSIADGLDDAGTLEKALAETRGARRLKFDCAGVSSYDSSLVCYVLRCVAFRLTIRASCATCCAASRFAAKRKSRRI